MKRIDLTITAQAPLAIGQRKPGGSVSEAMDYIPGGAIRGAIAAKILDQAPSAPAVDTEGNGDDFHKLFLNEQAAIFQNAYPAIAKAGDDKYERSTDVRLLPATALSSKTNSGFKPSPDSEKPGVFDSLIDGFCARAQRLFYEPNDLTGDRVEPFSGFYSKAGNTYRSHAVSKRLLTRVGINRRRATAQEEILYSLEVLDELQGKDHPQTMIYRSSILVQENSLAEQLHQFIQHNHDQFRLGGAASRGLGRVAITAEINDIHSQTDAVKQRIADFKTKMEVRWQSWAVFGSAQPLPEITFFTINLQSDAVLTEQWLRTMVISETMLRQFAHLNEADDPTLKLETAYSSYDYRSGWNAAWGLQKDLELVTKMGGVFLFSTQKPELWYDKLAALELWGVGDRTSEGFGQIQICDEFHLIFRENAV
ncbi:MAG: CRISPR-associated RAMP protein Csx10 [Leptolyngbyaceae cyanobacterium bins.302]|nr:CRISPR-associated RAMP protein Csx10 [Leptolyngbyaceae cyanobacterium bins.302]